MTSCLLINCSAFVQGLLGPIASFFLLALMSSHDPGHHITSFLWVFHFPFLLPRYTQIISQLLPSLSSYFHSTLTYLPSLPTVQSSEGLAVYLSWLSAL